MISKQNRLIDSGINAVFTNFAPDEAMVIQCCSVLLHYSWSAYQILTHAVAARAASLKLTSSWAFPDKRAISTGAFDLHKPHPSTRAPRSRCPSSWANPRSLVPFCWPTSEVAINRSTTWMLQDRCISRFESWSYCKAKLILVGLTNKPSFAAANITSWWRQISSCLVFRSPSFKKKHTNA